MSHLSNFFQWCIGFLSIIMVAIQIPLQAQSGMNLFGSFEQQLPSYWTKGAEPSGSTLSWATDQFRSMGKSLKITKTTTSEAAKWESENMADLWSEKHFKNVDIKFGMYYKTSGVNTNPTTEDQKWFVSYSFYREDGSLIGEKKFELDQSAASTTGWVADTTAVGEISLPEDSWKTIIRFVGGKDATGTVWTDDYLFVGRDGWAGQDWNTQLGVPTGWFYWMPPIGGNDGVLDQGYENTIVTDEYAYHGNYSLKFDIPVGTHDGFVGTRRYPLNSQPPLGQSRSMDEPQDITALNGVVPGDVIRISVWIKGMNLQPDSALAVGDAWSVSLTAIYHTTLGNNEGWGQYAASPDIPLIFPNATSFDWKQFYVDLTVPNPPAGQVAKSISVRLHPLGRFSGTVYMDQLTVEKLDLPELSEIGSFEQQLPSYWTKGAEPSGSTLSWATDQFRSMGKSLKITKTTTSEAAKWESENMADLWSEKHFKNVDIKFGMYYKTSGVNTNPTTEDQKWFVSYSFYREDGSLIGEKKFELDQSAASTTGWVADTTAVGEISLPEDSWKTIIRFVGGKDATGTVWTDDYLFVGRDGWAGQDWNTQLGVPTGWFYWMPPIGGNDGVLDQGYENTIVTDEYAYHGNYSLKFDIPVGTHDGFVGTRRYPLNSQPPLGQSRSMDEPQDITALNGVVPGDVIRISVWIKGMNLQPDSALAVGDAWSVSLTAIYHTTLGNNEGWGQYAASPDIPLIFPNATSFDWKQFYVDLTVPNPPAGQVAKSISVRLHPLGRFSGTVYMDALEIKKIYEVTEVKDPFLPEDFSLSQNFPNPFNPSTVISYSLPTNSLVTLIIYDLLGREVKTLINNEQNSGVYKVQWNGENDYGSKVSSGLYIYTIRTGQFNESRKMVLLK